MVARMKLKVGIVALAIALAGIALFGQASTTPSPVVATAAAPAQNRVVEQPLSFSGTSGTQTRPFILTGGSYEMQWEASPGARSVAICGVDLFDVPSGRAELLVNTLLDVDKSGRTSLYNVSAGQHYFKITDCGTWSVTIAPQ